MTGALLRVPRQAPLAPLPQWFAIAGSNLGWVGSDIVSGSAFFNGNTYFGMIDLDSNVRVGSFHHATRTVTISPSIVQIVPDVHCTPSVVVRQSDQRLVISVAPHNIVGGVHMYIAVSTNAEDVSSWGTATDIQTTLGGTSYTYAKLVQLSGESGKMYLFYRDEQAAGATSALCYSTSTDGGSTWSAQTTLYKNTGQQSYWAIDTDSSSRIDFLVSDGSAASSDPTASLYHFYYTGGGYHKSDGTVISTTLPLSPTDPTKIYDGSTNGGMRAPYSIRHGGSVAVWAAYDSAGSGSNEHYWYGVNNSGSWTVNQIVDSGSVPTTGFSEGGVAIDEIDTSHVYISRKVSGIWQMFLYATPDGGATWNVVPLSTDTVVSPDLLNLRPISPKNADQALRCMWIFGSHFLDTTNSYESSGGTIRAYPRPVS